MARSTTSGSPGGRAAKGVAAVALAAAPWVIEQLKDREVIEDLRRKATSSMRKLTLEGRVDGQIAALERAIAQPATSVQASVKQRWSDELGAVQHKRGLLDGPFDAKQRRLHLKSLLERLESLWQEILAEADR